MDRYAYLLGVTLVMLFLALVSASSCGPDNYTFYEWEEITPDLVENEEGEDEEEDEEDTVFCEDRCSKHKKIKSRLRCVDRCRTR